jgi:tetratricopeptide (TPR) repeat protein
LISVESAAQAPRSAEPGTAPISDTVEDRLESAQILHSEGLNDEAKKILRRLLISDPANLVVRKALQAIQDKELSGLLDGAHHFDPLRSTPELAPTNSAADEIEASLDQDLGLNLYGASIPTLEFFSDLESVLAGAGSRDRLDLGIAYLEMGSPLVAEHCFRTARQGDAGATSEENRERFVAASALLAQALLSAGKSLEALHILQEALKGASEEDQRVELVYLMARASEAVERPKDAELFYLKVRELEPGYRDVDERLRGLKAIRG